MSLGEVWWFWGDHGDDLLTGPVNALVAAGLVMENPGSGQRFVLDGQGCQVPWLDEDVIRRWREGEVVVLQLWLNRTTDVLVTVDRSNGLITLDLDGTTPEEARLVVFAALNAAIACSGSRFVVADTQLPDRGEDLVAWVGENTRDGDPIFEPDLMMSSAVDGKYAVTIKPESWLSPR